MRTSDEFKTLEQAIQGLLYPSKSPTAFKLSACSCLLGPGALTEQYALQLFGGGVSLKCEEAPISTFFDQLREHPEATKFRKLEDTLYEVLIAPQVFFLGEGLVRIFIVGWTSKGEFLVLKTSAVRP